MKALRMVIRREWHRMTSRRLYLGVCVVLPLLCLFFMATIFGNGQMAVSYTHLTLPTKA